MGAVINLGISAMSGHASGAYQISITPLRQIFSRSSHFPFANPALSKLLNYCANHNLASQHPHMRCLKVTEAMELLKEAALDPGTSTFLQLQRNLLVGNVDQIPLSSRA